MLQKQTRALKSQNKTIMKNTRIAQCAIAALFALLLFASCKKDTPTYACNPQMNAWAIKNMAKFENFTRTDLVSIISLDTEGTIYATLPAQNKCNIWKEKFTLAKEQLVTTEAEKAHLQAAIDYFKPEFWTSNQTLDQFNPWMENWGKQAMSQFGWDSSKLFIIAETWLMPGEMQSIADHYNTTPHVEYLPNSTGGGTPDCACRYSVSCQWFSEKCGGDCGGGVYKCGLAGTSKCTGICISNTSLAHPIDPNNPAQQDTVQHYYVH
jgi:hypothetical protein